MVQSVHPLGERPPLSGSWSHHIDLHILNCFHDTLDSHPHNHSFYLLPSFLVRSKRFSFLCPTDPCGMHVRSILRLHALEASIQEADPQSNEWK